MPGSRRDSAVALRMRSSFSGDSELAARLAEGERGFLEHRARMCSAHLRPDPCLAHRDDGIGRSRAAWTRGAQSSRSAMRAARAASPIITGMIGCSPAPRVETLGREHACGTGRRTPARRAARDRVGDSRRGPASVVAATTGAIVCSKRGIRRERWRQPADDRGAAGDVAAARAAQCLASVPGPDVDHGPSRRNAHACRARPRP